MNKADERVQRAHTKKGWRWRRCRRRCFSNTIVYSHRIRSIRTTTISLLFLLLLLLPLMPLFYISTLI